VLCIEAVDLGALEESYCEVLRSIWSQVPVIWEDGRLVMRPLHGDHRCAR
jgi:hypothetical protein